MTSPLNEGATAWRMRLDAGRPLFGLVQTMASAGAVSLAAAIGFDFIIVDSEHGEGDCADHAASLAAIAASGLLSAVRLKPGDHPGGERYAALGAGALLMANVQRAIDVERLAEAATSPAGAPLLFAMIESGAGVEELSAIASANQLAGLVIGPNDLASDLGQTDLQSDALLRVVSAIEAEARLRALALGSGVYPGFTLERLLGAGHSLIVVGSDIGAMRETWSATINDTREAFATWRNKSVLCSN